jgi:hypothetical protein
MARKAFHYMEVTFPQNVLDENPGLMPIGIMKKFLDDYIAETDSKDGKVLKEFVFNEIQTFKWNDNVGAYAFEFINERNRNTYFTARKSFDVWLAEKGVETSYKLSHDIPLNLVPQLSDGKYEESTYYNMAKNFIMFDIPTSRGFATQA